MPVLVILTIKIHHGEYLNTQEQIKTNELTKFDIFDATAVCKGC
jgi:hypothetical protein